MLVIDNPAATLHLAVLIIPFFFFFHFRYWISFVSRELPFGIQVPMTLLDRYYVTLRYAI